jgi:hypothetical protein
VIIGVSCSGKGKDESQQGAGGPNPSPEGLSAPPATDIDVKDVGPLADLIVASAQELPRAEFDSAIRAASLGKDPGKIFEWVRDRTWWVPYRGLLRGPKGVMLDRVGSNLDRAALLGDLMLRNGYAVRLAHTRLTDEQAQELLGKLSSFPDQRSVHSQPTRLSEEQQRAAKELLSDFDENLRQQTAVAEQRLGEAKALVRAQTDGLYAAVQNLAQGGQADAKTVIAALQDHWWVEYDQGGKWVAMDVLLPDAKLGEAITTASTTHAWAKADDAPAIPEADWHSVQIKIVVERYESGATSEFTVLETVLRPAEVLDQPIQLSHVPRPWPDSFADPRKDHDVLKNASLWVTEWIPFLQVGSTFIAQAAFTDRGELKKRAADPVGQLGGGGLTGGMEDALGGGVGEVESFASAEWIDYEVRVPGERNERLRRPIFDILGPAQRAKPEQGFEIGSDALKLERAEALWSRTDILLQPCDFTEAFVADLGTASIVANQAALRQLSLERDPVKAGNQASALLGRIAVWGPLPDLVLWRSVLASQPGDWFIGRPNVLNYRVSRPKVEEGRVVQPHMIDIASNSIGVRHSAGAESFRIRLAQGVADTVAELIALGENFNASANTASVFAATPASFKDSAVIGPGNAGSVRDLDWAADPALRLEEDIGEGFMAVALMEPVAVDGENRVGWWRVNPTTGETIGVMDNGFHLTMAERAALAAPLIAAIQSFLQRHPIPPAPAIGTAARAAWQATYGGMAVLQQGLWVRLTEAARAGFCVTGINCV